MSNSILRKYNGKNDLIFRTEVLLKRMGRKEMERRQKKN